MSPQFIGTDTLATFLGCAEIFRRGMWNFFRLENQHLHNCEDFRSISFRMSDMLGSLDKHVDANFFQVETASDIGAVATSQHTVGIDSMPTTPNEAMPSTPNNEAMQSTSIIIEAAKDV